MTSTFHIPCQVCSCFFSFYFNKFSLMSGSVTGEVPEIPVMPPVTTLILPGSCPHLSGSSPASLPLISLSLSQSLVPSCRTYFKG